jgi:hypothetical protein
MPVELPSYLSSMTETEKLIFVLLFFIVVPLFLYDRDAIYFVKHYIDFFHKLSLRIAVSIIHWKQILRKVTPFCWWAIVICEHDVSVENTIQ